MNWIQIPPEVIIWVSSMLPLTSLRASIPAGLFIYDMPLWEVFLLTYSANLFISYFWIFALDPLANWSRKWIKPLDRLLTHIFEKTRTKHSKRISELGHIALIFYIAAPLPGSGAWTGALISYVFGIRKRTAMLLLAIGLFLATSIVCALSLGVFEIIQA